jgi:hypothetical protein
MSQLKEKYKKELVPMLQERLGFTNVMQVPRLEKIVLNIGLGEAITNAKAMEGGEADLAAIAGQHPVITKSRRSISAFRLRGDWSKGNFTRKTNVGVPGEIGNHHATSCERIPGCAPDFVRRARQLYSGFQRADRVSGN